VNSPAYVDLTACTLVPEANVSYLAHTSGTPVVAPMSGPTLGLMMFLSTLQYQSSYLGPTYSNAAGQAGKAAFVEAGGPQGQNNLRTYGLNQSHEMGLTNAEGAIIFGTARILQKRQIDWTGPSLYSVKPHLTLSPQSGSIGLKYEW